MSDTSSTCPNLIRAWENVRYIAACTKADEDDNKEELTDFDQLDDVIKTKSKLQATPPMSTRAGKQIIIDSVVK